MSPLATLALVTIVAASGGERTMEIKRAGTQASQKGPAEWFTGTVRIDPLFQAHDPARASGAYVTFEPCARSAWHTHPLGQLLIVVSGVGRVQQWGGPVEEIRTGDVVWTPPGVKHWHGAAPTTAMTHLATQEALNGKAVDWMEKVSDEQYGAAVKAVPDAPSRAAQPDALAALAPALAGYESEVVFGELWKRGDLSPRDRSLVALGEGGRRHVLDLSKAGARSRSGSNSTGCRHETRAHPAWSRTGRRTGSSPHSTPRRRSLSRAAGPSPR